MQTVKQIVWGPVWSISLFCCFFVLNCCCFVTENNNVEGSYSWYADCCSDFQEIDNGSVSRGHWTPLAVRSIQFNPAHPLYGRFTLVPSSPLPFRFVFLTWVSWKFSLFFYREDGSIWSVETLIAIYKTIQSQFTADGNLYICHNESLKCYTSALRICAPCRYVFVSRSNCKSVCPWTVEDCSTPPVTAYMGVQEISRLLFQQFNDLWIFSTVF